MTTVVTDPRRLLLGSLAALGAGSCYGATSLIARRIVSDYASPTVGTAFSLLFGALMVLILFHRHALGDVGRAPRRAWLLVALAGCASTWGVGFLFLALSKAPVVVVAPLDATSPLVSLVLTHLFLQRLERVTWRTVAGAALVVGGVVLIALGRG